MTLRSRGAGMLVLSDTWYPGWHATVDGHDAKVERVDYLLRGVRVGPGTPHGADDLPAAVVPDRLDRLAGHRAGAARRGARRRGGGRR